MQRLGDEDNKLFPQKGEDTFNSLLALVKRVYPSMFYLYIISLHTLSKDP